MKETSDDLKRVSKFNAVFHQDRANRMGRQHETSRANLEFRTTSVPMTTAVSEQPGRVKGSIGEDSAGANNGWLAQLAPVTVNKQKPNAACKP